MDCVTKETWRSATTGATVHSMYFDYDTAGRLGTVKELRGAQTGTPLTEYVYAYDNLDRLTSVTDTANSAANSTIPNTLTALPVGLTHTFNALGDLSQTSSTINALADFNNSYQYDFLGRMTQVVQAGTAAPGQPPITRKRVDLAYNPAGQFQRILRSSGSAGAETEVATSAYVYFNGGGRKQIDHTHSGAPLVDPPSSGVPISSYAWTYDTAGRVASFTAPEGTFAYGYDNTHQLTSATFTANLSYSGGTPPTESFNFDATGNRQGTGHLVDRNRLLSDGTYNYTYDNEGNRLSRTEIATGKVINYTWDHRNRLIKVEFRNSAGGPVTKIVANSYDAFDRRVMKQVDDNADGTFDRTERYVWDGDDVVLVLDLAGNVLHRFLHRPSIDQIFADESAVNGLLWDLTDNQGTVRDVIDNSGTVVNHLTYSAFGVLASESNAAKTPFFAYTGRDWDEDVQLQYNRGRWYEPSTGRWLSEDPSRFAAGEVNLQRYVENRPADFSDSSGLTPNRDDAIGVDALIAIIEAIERLHKGKSPQEIAKIISDLIRDDVISESYIYTKDYGWIDTVHFFNAIAFELRTGGTGIAAGSGGFMVEMVQAIVGPLGNGFGSSAFNSEDIPSNMLGHTFVLQYLGSDPLFAKPDDTLSSRLRDFLMSAGAVDPPADRKRKPFPPIPDWTSLPQSEADHERDYRDRRKPKPPTWVRDPDGFFYNPETCERRWGPGPKW